MGACISSAACCACSAATGLISCCCSGRASISARAAKFFYFVIVVLSAILALTFNYWLPSLAEKLNISDHCHCDSGVLAVYRVSFAVFLFFASLVFGSCASTGIHLGWWGIKILGLLAYLVIAFVIPIEFYEGYVRVAQWASILFLVAMILMLIDAAYNLQDWFLTKMDLTEDDTCCSVLKKCWSWVYLLTVVLLLGGGFTGLGFLFDYSVVHSCQIDQATLSITLIAFIIYSLLNCTPWNTESSRGIVTPSVVFVYTIWLMWSAFSNWEDPKCNPVPEGESTGNVVVGALVAAVSLGYTCFSASRNLSKMFGSGNELPPEAEEERMKLKEDRKQRVEQMAYRDTLTANLTNGYEVDHAATTAEAEYDREEARLDREEAQEQKEEEQDKAKKGEERPQFWKFHVIMVIAALYMSMVLTNWEVDITSDADVRKRRDDTTAWITIVSQWFTILIYVWTLIAPKCHEYTKPHYGHPQTQGHALLLNRCL